MSHRRLLSLALIPYSPFLPPALAVARHSGPDFKGTDSNGVQHSLSEYRGKFVVLEWANQGCPYDRKHYLSGSIESQQRDWTAKDVVWLTVISSAPAAGLRPPSEENTYLKTMHAAPTARCSTPPARSPALRSQDHGPTSSSSTQPASSSIRARSTTNQQPSRQT